MRPDHLHLTYDPKGRRSGKQLPLVAAPLALFQLLGVLVATIPSVQKLLAVSPDAIFRGGQVWRLALGPFVASEFAWPLAVFSPACILIFGWHLECVQGRRRLLVLFFGGSVFAASLWSIAALVWNWHLPLFSPVASTTLAVGTLLPGIRKPFPAYLPFRVPVWVVFVAYAALWEASAFAGAIDLSAHFLAGLFAILVAQSGSGSTTRSRTIPHPLPVTTSPEVEPTRQEQARPDRRSAMDPEFDRRVDDLLRKITETGYDSLAEDEIALLLEASQRYRNRPAPPPT